MESSKMQQRQQQTSQEDSADTKVVNTPGPRRVPSALVTQTMETSYEEVGTNLMERVLDRRNLLESLERVKANKGAPGADGMSVDELEGFLRKNWRRIKEELLNGTYKPLPVLRVEIPKPDGGTRPLGIPGVVDRFIQQAINQVLSPLFDPSFSQYSYGFRPNRSAKMAPDFRIY